MNKQRETIYGLRRELLEGHDQKVYVTDAMDRVVGWLATTYCPKDQRGDAWNVEGLKKEAWSRFGIDLRKHALNFDPKAWEQLKDELIRIVHERYEEREKVWGEERIRQHERMIMLQVVDTQWKRWDGLDFGLHGRFSLVQRHPATNP